MTDLDVRLRELVQELALDPPDVQPFDELGIVRHLGAPSAPRHRARRIRVARALVAATIVVFVALVGLVVVDRVERQPAEPRPAGACVPDPGRFTGADGRTFGPLKRKQVPDFVRVACPGGGVFGWARSSDVLPQLAGPTLDSLAVNGPRGTAMCDRTGANVGTLQTSPRYPVFAKDGTTLVGYVYPPIGYRALGDAPRSYPDRNGLRPCSGDMTALPTQPASSRAQLAWPNAVDHDVDYASYSSLVGLTDPPDPQRYGNHYVTVADMVRRAAAAQAKVQGEPYNPADLLWPLRDEAGRIRKYAAVNARTLTRAEVSDRDFDLCRIQIASNLALRKRIAQLPPEARPTVPEGVSSNVTGDPAESVGCKKG